MKFANTLRALGAGCAFAVTAHASAAPILLVNSDGKLTGANGIDVGGTLYNVTFASGSCISLFNGCVQSAFAFNTMASARVAAMSLLDQVFLDSVAGRFDSDPSKTFGCGIPGFNACNTEIPYAIHTYYVYKYTAYNGTGLDVGFSGISFQSNVYEGGLTNYAVFKLATTDVPEPSSIALFGLALAGLAFNRRRTV